MKTIIELLMVIQTEINTMLKMQSQSMYKDDEKAKVDRFISSLDKSFHSILEKEKESSK